MVFDGKNCPPARTRLCAIKNMINEGGGDAQMHAKRRVEVEEKEGEKRY